MGWAARRAGKLLRALAVAAGGIFVFGQGVGAVGPQLEHAGQELYAQHCAGCHGPAGKGDGVRAPGLRAPPPDLTRLAIRYGEPIPLAGLLHHVVSPRSQGGPRICGDQDRWWADHGYGIALERRGTVFSALIFLGTLQSRQEAAPERAPTR